MPYFAVQIFLLDKGMEAFLSFVKTAHVEVEEMVIYSCEAETALFILFKHFCVSNDKVCMTRLAPLLHVNSAICSACRKRK